MEALIVQAAMEQHFAHLKEQANLGLITKEAKSCVVCRTARAKLKAKYRESKGGGNSGKTTTRSNHKAPKVGLAALMRHPIAIKLHYDECKDRGWWEQLPVSLRPLTHGGEV